MIYETFTCSKRGGTIEYGYTFKAQEGDEDTLFDLVLGEINPDNYSYSDFSRKLEACWSGHEWAAKAICQAAPTEKD